MMLILTRKEGERVMLAGGTIVITVVEIRGDRVRVGFEAPPDVKIQREELLKRDGKREEPPLA
jgi:carbon storage regulator